MVSIDQLVFPWSVFSDYVSLLWKVNSQFARTVDMCVVTYYLFVAAVLIDIKSKFTVASSSHGRRTWVEIVRSSSLCWCCSDWMLRISKLTRTLMQDDHLLILTRAYITHDNIQLHITRKEAEDKKSCKRNCSVVHLIMCTNVNILLSVNYTLRLKIHLFNSFN